MKLKLTAMATALIVALTACDGDDGAAGPTGPQGATGPQGEQGPQGNPGSSGSDGNDAGAGAIFLNQIGRFETGVFDESAAEIVAYDAATQRLFVVNANVGQLDVIDISNPASPSQVGTIDAAANWPEAGEINSVAVSGGVVAAGVQNDADDGAGKLMVYNAADLVFRASVDVGVLPDSVAFSPDGSKVLVANEGEPLGDYSIDPEGSISIVDMSDPSNPVATQLGFGDFNVGGSRAADIDSDVRIFGNFGRTALTVTALTDTDPATITVNDASAVSVGDVFTLGSEEGDPINYWVRGIEANTLTLHDEFDGDSEIVDSGIEGLTVYLHDGQSSVAQDLEPEYVAVSPDGTTAVVTMQENNAIAVVDVNAASIVAIKSLGVKDHNLIGNELDASDEDDKVNIRNWPVKGMFMPDAVAAFERNGQTYYITANEGDAREYDAYVEELRYEDAVDLGIVEGDLLAPEFADRAELGRLLTTLTNDSDANGLLDQAWSFGARSFSIWDASGNLVFDSGSDFALTTAQLLGNNFNNDNDENDGDSRSDAKGSEPEAVAVIDIDERTYAFIGLERVGGVMVYDVSNPFNPQYVQYTTNRDFDFDIETIDDGVAAAGAAGDLGPEGMITISAADSPIGEPLLIVASEVSGTTTIYQIHH